MRVFRNDRGFSLVELMVVLAILGILVALVVPRYLGTRKQAYSAEAVSVLNEIKASQWSYFQRHDTFATELEDIGFKPPTGSRWRYSIEEADEDHVVIKATGAARPLESTDTITLTLTAEGEAKLESSF